MRLIQTIGSLLGATTLILAIGCEHHPSTTAETAPGTPSPTGVTNEQNMADRHVADRLARSRCDQADRCNDVGPGRKFISRDVCLQDSRAKMRQELNAYDCPRGIAESAIDTCVTSMEQKGCGFSVDNLFSQNRCDRGSLCVP
jgi:Family of unknown function (DUF6184)